MKNPLKKSCTSCPKVLECVHFSIFLAHTHFLTQIKLIPFLSVRNMSAFLNNSVSNFLTKFVSEEKHEEARSEMEEMFASMAVELGRELFRNFKGVTESSDSDSEEKPKKKRAPRKKKEDSEKKEKVERPGCAGLTAAGNHCKNKAAEGEELCHVHLKKKNEPPKEKKEKTKKVKEPKEKKEKKTKTKKTPEHNHELTEETSDCELCETHGNKIDPEFVEEFELDGDTKSTLQAILARASDSEESDEEDEELKFLQQQEEEEIHSEEEQEILDMPELNLESPPKPKSRPKSTRK